MKKVICAITLFTLLTLTVLLPGCMQTGSALNGSGKIKDQDIELDDFDSIQVQGPFNLEIIQSASFKITLSTDDNLISRVQFSHSDKTLKVKIEAPATFFPTSLKISIAMPRIHSVNLSDGAKATIPEFNSVPNFNLVLTGGSSLNGNVEAEAANFYLSGGSQIILQGNAKKLVLDSAGASRLNLGDFILVDADVKLREASAAILNINGELNVVLKDASKIYYLGNPLITNTSITGDSSMIGQ